MVVTNAVRVPMALGCVVKVMVNWVAVAEVTIPVPLLNVTVLLPAVVSKPVPAMVQVVVALIARLAVLEVTVGPVTTVVMLFKSTLALLELKFAVMMSSLPSPFTSPSVTDCGLAPVAKVCWAWKVPLPLPKSTLALSDLKFAVMMSSLPSPFTSPSVTENGVVPVV